MLIRNKRVSLDNDSLIFGQSSEVIDSYLRDRLGNEGYVLGLRGKINEASARILAQLDPGLKGNKVILEAAVNPSEILTFSVTGIEEAVEILSYGLPDDVLVNHLDQASLEDVKEGSVQVVCAPAIDCTCNIRVTSLNREIDIQAQGITCVKLPSLRK